MKSCNDLQASVPAPPVAQDSSAYQMASVIVSDLMGDVTDDLTQEQEDAHVAAVARYLGVQLRRFAPTQDWQPIETAPTNTSVLVFVPRAEHYGPGIYRAILVDMGTGRRWMTTGCHVGRDLGPDSQPTHWMPLPAPPRSADGVP